MIPSAARLGRLETYIATQVADYLAMGYTPTQAAELATYLRAAHIPEWMEYADAQMIVMDVSLGVDSSKYTADEIASSNRTSVTATRAEKAKLLSERMRVSYHHALGWVDKIERGEAVTDADLDAYQPCAMYRHVDADGVLLYIGIATDPDLRREQHAATSKWFRFASRMDVDWYETRGDAEAAERSAIQADLPIFNKTHGGVFRGDRVVDYLVRHSATDLLEPVI